MTLADDINRMIETILRSSTWTSAGGKNPVENFIKEFRGATSPDLEISTGEQPRGIKEIKPQQLSEAVKKVDLWDKGKLGEIERFTSSQFGNLTAFVRNPAGFLISAFFKKFAKGVGVLLLATLIFEAVKFIISELLKPGRALDIRFKRDIKDEIIAFRKREEQQKLKQGFSNIIITTQPRLRGGQNQIVNTLDLVRSRNFPDNIGFSQIQLEAAGQPLSKAHGRRSFSR